MAFTAETIAQDNLCVIWVDDMIDVFTWRNAFGIPIQTPNLDRLLNAGVRFSNTYATVPLCAPCRAELATGLSPFRTGLVDLNRFWRNVHPPEKAWAYDLRRAGFYNFTTGKVDATYRPMPERYRRVLFHEDVLAVEREAGGQAAFTAEGVPAVGFRETQQGAETEEVGVGFGGLEGGVLVAAPDERRALFEAFAGALAERRVFAGERAGFEVGGAELELAADAGDEAFDLHGSAELQEARAGRAVGVDGLDRPRSAGLQESAVLEMAAPGGDSIAIATVDSDTPGAAWGPAGSSSRSSSIRAAMWRPIW